MSNEVTIVLSDTECGPAMKALEPKQRAFVVAWCNAGGQGTSAIVTAAGYTAVARGALRVQGHRLLHNPKVIAAIREYASARFKAEAATAQVQLLEVAENPQHKDHVKALGMLLNRGGFPDVHQMQVDIKVTLTKAEEEAKIAALKDELGISVDELLGERTIEGTAVEIFDPDGLL